MPTYEYRCDKCGHEFEREQRITDDPVKTCPKCRGRKVQRLISATSFVLKGGGWYSDLYSSKQAKKSDSGDAASGSDSGSSGAKDASASKSTDAKPKSDAASKSDGKGKGKSKKSAA